MRRSVIVPLLLAALAALPGCNLRNDQLLNIGVAVGSAAAIGYTVDNLVSGAAQRDLQRREFEERRESRLFQQDEQRAQRLSSEDFQRERLEIQKNQLRPRR